ncbi:MAG: M6 family metalloprotease domain-containing protein [candidate division Zixibacteria bacterium]|nr:M6 family metalloprotease domain-containing protein [candidate division Zixibacteria bacterium]
MRSNRIFRFKIIKLTAALAGLIFLTLPVAAMPPHPDIFRSDKTDNREVKRAVIDQLKTMRAKGIGAAGDFFLKDIISGKGQTTQAAASGPYKILAILVDFSDQPALTPATFFDSLVYGLNGNTIHDYFDEVSNGLIDLTTITLPSETGWQRAPNSYQFYTDSAFGTGIYPNNSQKLVEDLVNQVDYLVDFGEYDNDNDGYLDILLVIHSGSGAEYTRDRNDIWSHKWNISRILRDGVYISDYTIQPEFWSTPGDMTIGVYCHELSHGFGLPDLYDTDGSSYGIGYWGIMAYGSWNGPNGRGGSPAHHCAWSKIQMGIAGVVDITSTQVDLAVSAVETGGTIYRLRTADMGTGEYFLIENRQPYGYDAYLPSSGLLIWHIDDSKSTNREEWYPGENRLEHYLVALEQADGLFELEQRDDFGDSGDPFPGTTYQTSFNAATVPDNSSYIYDISGFTIDDISNSDSVMTLNITVDFAASLDNPSNVLPDKISLSQNFPNPFNPLTQIEFSSTVGGEGTLEVFNALGQKVSTAYEGMVTPGTTTLSWEAVGDDHTILASGVYFYKLTVGRQTAVKKMLLVR